MTIRSRFMLEVAHELVGRDAGSWPLREARVVLNAQGDSSRRIGLFATDTPESVRLVAGGAADFAMINPSMLLTSAFLGAGPFSAPAPVRAVTVIPSPDQLGLAVAGHTGLARLSDVARRRFPLRVSLRDRRDHSVHDVLRETLAAAGFSLADLESWGGAVRYDPGLPGDPRRIEAAARGEVDAVFDEAVPHWADQALAAGLRFLAIDEPVLASLEAIGFRRAVIRRRSHPRLDEDVPSVDFSGWAVFVRADVPDRSVEEVCAAVEARREHIAFEEPGPLPLDRMCRDTPEGPLGVPLHPAAERFWRRRGYL